MAGKLINIHKVLRSSIVVLQWTRNCWEPFQGVELQTVTLLVQQEEQAGSAVNHAGERPAGYFNNTGEAPLETG